MKNKETLEEAAVINYKKLYEGEPLTQDVPIDAFKQGARWQQERSYSEEEVMDLLNNLRLDSYNHGMGRIEFLEWFEQIKKK